MAVLWKVLAGLFLTLPPGAYLVGTVVGPPQLATEPPPAVTSHATPRPPSSSPVPSPPAPSVSAHVAAVRPVGVDTATPTVVASPRTKAAKPRAVRRLATPPSPQPYQVDQTWTTQWPSVTPTDPTPSQSPSASWTEPPPDTGDPTVPPSDVAPTPTPDFGTPQPQNVDGDSSAW